ncbi:HesB/YadR/YfhF family protein [Lacticigenium naphthae]|uniref:HesB/YadR/YfhF family protein n=1 Tax=Lacticigenium naphthae TaxID=515351 RepID=UPI0003FC728C|nr:iron-sulfur cluster biosynthesis protein [Lacticigenium naphthae]
MDIKISNDAIKWFEEEMGIGAGLGVRFFGKVYGKTEVHTGFSVGIQVAEPHEPIAKTIVNEIPYFAETEDEWFFNGYHLSVELDPDKKEPIYHFIEI